MFRQAEWLRQCFQKTGKFIRVFVSTLAVRSAFAQNVTQFFNMITNGETEIIKIIAITGNGKCGAPCGACRELMIQLMPKNYKDIEIMSDFESGRIVKLGEITPEWWI